MRSTQTGRRGFTLIELLVVIAIIALLVSILAPSLNGAKELAREAVCMTNVHSLTLASVMYASEHDGWFPETAKDMIGDHDTSIGLYHGIKYWRDLLGEQYGVARDIFYSPSNPRWNHDQFYIAPESDWGNRFVMGYFSFGGDRRLNEPWFRNKLVDAPADAEGPLFPRQLTDQPIYKIVWADMNKQWPPDSGWSAAYGATGANHYNTDADHPKCSHVGRPDSSVERVPGEDIELRAIRDVGLYW